MQSDTSFPYQTPKFEFTSSVRPSIFAYVPEIKAKEKEAVELVKTAVLSTTAKSKARNKEKERQKTEADGDVAMDTDEKKDEEATADKDTEMKTDEATPAAGEEAKEKKKKNTPEPSTENLSNLSRVVPAQMPYISFPSSSRYVPVRPLSSAHSSTSSSSTNQPTKSSASPSAILESIVASGVGLGAGGGILVLKDRKPDEAEEFVEPQARKALQLAATGGDELVPEAQGQQGAPEMQQDAPRSAAVDVSAPIADMPEPFEYDGFED